MLNTYEATIDGQGKLCIPEGLKLPEGCKILITVLEKLSPTTANDEALLSESTLQVDWNKPEEEDAWNCLNQEQ